MHADNKIYAPDPSSDFVELAAEVFGLLSDATRIRMVLHLRRAGELSVNALAELVEKSPSGVSQHLARLRMARMVTTRQVGNKVLYSLTDEHPACLVSEAIKQAEYSVSNGQLPLHHEAPNA
jgi:DNA-binding transcriptional ArsR family regulator